MDYIIFVLWMNFIIYTFGIDSTANYLENVSYSNTVTLALIVLMLQITTVLGIKILVLLFLTIALKTHCLVKRAKVQHSHCS